MYNKKIYGLICRKPEKGKDAMMDVLDFSYGWIARTKY